MSSTNQTCVNGGPNVGRVDLIMPKNIPTNMDYIGIEGNDTLLSGLQACCKDHRVHFIEPCTLWCEMEGNLDIMYDCFVEYGGLKYQSAFTHYRGLDAQISFNNYTPAVSIPTEAPRHSLTTGQIAGIIVGAIAILVVIGLAIWRIVVYAKGRKVAARHNRLQEMEAGFDDFSTSIQDVGGYKDYMVKHRA